MTIPLIRRATVADAPALAQFAARTFQETFGAANDPDHLAAHLAKAYGRPQQEQEIRNPDGLTLLVDAAGELAGYAQVRRHRPPPCVTDVAPVELARFYVDRQWYGRGLAQRLMAAVVDGVLELGGGTVWLGVWERNLRAIAFYTKSGFSDAGSTEFLVGPDRQTDRVLVAPVERLREGPSMETRRFYDDLAPYYDLIFEDWDASMSRQGDAITTLIEGELGAAAGSAEACRVLDAACGIGTQTLPLAARGFEVTGRDLAPGAVARLKREAAARHLTVDAAVADMRSVAQTVNGPFDAVIAFDNSVPHLLTDGDILRALGEFRRLLRPGGVCLCSVRDYDLVERGMSSTHPYGERVRGKETFGLRQEWTWEDPKHYQMTLVIERLDAAGSASVLQTTSKYYAVPIARLLELMSEAGFAHCRRLDAAFYQPVLVGRHPA